MYTVKGHRQAQSLLIMKPRCRHDMNSITPCPMLNGSAEGLGVTMANTLGQDSQTGRDTFAKSPQIRDASAASACALHANVQFVLSALGPRRWASKLICIQTVEWGGVACRTSGHNNNNENAQNAPYNDNKLPIWHRR